jgi:hypothetical protein
LQVHQPKEEVEQLDEEMTTSHPFRTGTAKPPAAPTLPTPTLPTPASRKPTQPQQKAKIKPVGEEVENWVNSLIEEGYDLSDYTWEDMYEMYVNLDEEYDTFDAILEHLVAEGFADTNESALVIMANMSEEWREEILDEAVRGSGRSIADRITGNDIRGVTRKGKTVYKKPKWKDEVDNKVGREYRGYALRRQGETENMNDRRDRERIEANKKSIQRLNAKTGEDPGDYDAGYYGDDDTSNGKRHYSLSRTNRDARRRRASGR